MKLIMPMNPIRFLIHQVAKLMYQENINSRMKYRRQINKNRQWNNSHLVKNQEYLNLFQNMHLQFRSPTISFLLRIKSSSLLQLQLGYLLILKNLYLKIKWLRRMKMGKQFRLQLNRRFPRILKNTYLKLRWQLKTTETTEMENSNLSLHPPSSL